MNINLNDEIIMETYSDQIVLKRLTGSKDKKGKPNYTIEGYYNSITSALQGYARKSIIRSEAKDIKTLVKEVKEINQYIHKMLGGK